jgi:hypothetical protein
LYESSTSSIWFSTFAFLYMSDQVLKIDGNNA